MNSMFTFTVHGKPHPKGSVVAFVPRTKSGYATWPNGSPKVVKHDDTSDESAAWSESVTVGARQAMLESGLSKALTEHDAVEVSVLFSQPRIRGHYGTGKNQRTLKASAPAYPAKRPDIDKWLRAVLDAMKGTTYNDDGQVVMLVARKVYVDISEPWRTVITVRFLDSTAAVPVEDGDLEQLALEQLELAVA